MRLAVVVFQVAGHGHEDDVAKVGELPGVEFFDPAYPVFLFGCHVLMPHGHLALERGDCARLSDRDILF